tara:strand:+ start:28933 stop:29970 length:1038 start_codon:yes stop_codon:yes gene_type:complete
MTTVLIAAGGTGGHVFPGLAVADALQQKNIKVVWIGTQHGLDTKLVPQTQIPFYSLAIKGLRGKRKLSLLLAPFKIIVAIIHAMKIIRKTKADMILGMGGYVSGPAGIAAWLMRKPLVIHEQNAIAGMTNKLLSRFATTVLQAFPDTLKNAVTTGNPIRSDIMNIQHEQSHEPLRVLVLGGSQGAQAINQIMPAVLQQLVGQITVWHQAGAKHVENAQQAYGHADVKLTAFIDDMTAAYAWADVVICRAGALTVAEVAAAGLPAIFVPFPSAVDDHQTANAKYLIDNGAGLLIQQRDLNPDKLTTMLGGFLTDPSRLKTMAVKAKQLANSEATKNVVNQLLSAKP